MIDLKAIRKRLEKATKGPWNADTMQPFDCVVWAKNGDSVAQIGQPMTPCTTWEELMTMQNAGEARLIAEAEKSDAKFIAHSRTDMEQLLEAVETAIHLVNGAKTSVLNTDWHDAANKFLARFK